MDYSTDRPINKSEEDLLGRASFSKYLGEAIYKYKGSDGLVIGLFGKWGTGKTSIINMAIEEITDLSKNDENKPIIMDFSPWNYSDKNNLISLFFQSLKIKLGLEGNEKLKNDIGTALSNYADAFEVLSIVPIFGQGLATLLKTIAKSEGNNLMQVPDLDTTKKILEERLKENNQKIIIVIDDIDRLTNIQIRDIFQLVKQVADFPNIIYILSMDRGVVSRALEEVHKIDGNQYLEKIIQLPFEIPELSKSKLNSIFFSKLDKIIKELPYNVIWDEDYWGNIFRNCIEPYIKTLRDVNRVINTFSFRYAMLYEETCFEDMIAITTIEVLEPKLYKWIYNNKYSVCGGLLHGLSIGKSKIDYKKKYTDEFSSIGVNAERAINYLSTIFPIFAKDVNSYGTGYLNFSNIRGKMRVAHEVRFDIYFAFDLDDIKISRNIINAFIYKFDSNELRRTIIEVNNQGYFKFFIDELIALIDKIPYERLGLIASVLLCIRGELKEEKNTSFLELSSYNSLEYRGYDIIKRIKTPNERFDVIKNTLEDMSKFGLGVIACTINRIELSYGRLAGDFENEEEQIISEEDLLKIEKIYIDKIQNIDYSDSILGIKEFYMAFYLWESLDKDGAKNYISYIFKDDVQKLRFICSFGRFVGNVWAFSYQKYSEYISDEEIYNLIQGFAKKNLDKFSELELIKLATFVLNYGKENRKYGANEEQASKLVEEWKQSK